MIIYYLLELFFLDNYSVCYFFVDKFGVGFVLRSGTHYNDERSRTRWNPQPPTHNNNNANNNNNKINSIPKKITPDN